MKTAVLIGALALATVGCAEDAEAQWYLGGGGTAAKYDVDGSTEDQNALGYFVNGGYDFGSVGLEVEAKRLNDTEVGGNVDIDSQDSLTLYGVGEIPLGESPISLLFKGGVGVAKTELKGFGQNDSDTTWYPAIAGGVKMDFTDHLMGTVTVDYKKMDYDAGGNDVSLDPASANIGIAYKF